MVEKEKFSLLKDYEAALHVLDEFCKNVEVVGLEEVTADWPSLAATYEKACAIVRDDEEDE